ncbi:3D domain-containing protein [Halobacillus campisalis]|uniref:3D domain-containing protein n=1 Tax=Halobacillus campisalis TaxID=435909 RepID=A0ABW2K5K2_9BACI
MKFAIILFSFMSFYTLGILGFNPDPSYIQADEKAEMKETALSEKSEKHQRFINDENEKEVIKTVNVEATAYTAFCEGCSGVTKTGIDLRDNPDQKVIAVDPDVIPLGSKVHVPGYGEAIAGDTGGAIKGNRVDLFMKENSEAMDYGRQQIEVEVLSS